MYKHPQMTICTVCTIQLHCMDFQTASIIGKKCLIAANYLVHVSHALSMHSLLVYRLRYYTFAEFVWYCVVGIRLSLKTLSHWLQLFQ